MTKRHITAAACALLSAAGCGRQAPDQPPEQASPHVAEEVPHWSYAGSGGPDEWSGLSPDYAVCGTGGAQSPVDLSRTVPDPSLPPLESDYRTAAATVVNNGHTLQASVEDGGTLRRGEHRYDLLQFHYHAPSEHTVDGAAAAAELHLVHRAADGSLGVLGLLLDVGETAHPGIDALLQAAALPAGDVVSVTIDPASLLPADLDYVSYAGSLTTPPCSEGVHWMVLRTRGSLTAEQLAQLRSLLGANARPVMPLGERQLRVTAS